MNRIKILFIFLIGNILFFQSCNENESFDPRDPFVGSYRCKVIYKNNLDPDHAMYKRDTIYYTTLDVSKHESSSILQISDELQVEVEFSITDSTFKGIGQRIFGRFFLDSIYMYSFLTPAAVISKTYLGKKIKI
jgi:hypothetical protein